MIPAINQLAQGSERVHGFPHKSLTEVMQKLIHSNGSQSQVQREELHKRAGHTW